MIDEIEKAIEVELKKLNKKIADAEKQVKEYDKEVERLYEKKEKAIADLKRQIGKISKPFDTKIETIGQISGKLDSKRYGYQIDKNTVKYRIRAKFAENLPEFPDGDSFKGFLLSKGVHTRTIEIIKKKLTNGITLVRTYDSLYGNEKGTSSTADAVGYFAVKGKEIVGFIFTKKSKHPGDSAEVYCWINSKYLRKNNQLSQNTYAAPPTIGFKKWKQMISEIKEFIPIDLDDEKNKKILASYWTVDYESMEDDKEK